MAAPVHEVAHLNEPLGGRLPMRQHLAKRMDAAVDVPDNEKIHALNNEIGPLLARNNS